MIGTITSKFTTTFWIQVVIFSLFIFGSTVYAVDSLAENYDSYNWGKISSVIIFLVLLLTVYIYVFVRSLRRITAAPEGIVINYLITQRRIVINYADIVHVSNLRVNANRDNILSSSYLKLVIELSTGEDITFTEQDYDNYDDLKEAIREYRFHLN